MKKLLFSIYLTCLAVGSAEEPLATLKWMTTEKRASGSGEIITIIQMQIKENWYTYWKNPGQAGLPLSVKANLPTGWKLGEIQFPVPQLFKTGALHSFGYTGTVNFVLPIIPPNHFDRKLDDFSATFSWLTCNNKACISGEVTTTLQKHASEEIVSTTLSSMPQPISGSKLFVKSEGERIQLILEIPEKLKMDLNTFHIYPATADIIAAGHKTLFTPDTNTPNRWIAETPQNEFFTPPLNFMEILAVSQKGEPYIFQTGSIEKQTTYQKPEK